MVNKTILEKQVLLGGVPVPSKKTCHINLNRFEFHLNNDQPEILSFVFVNPG